jgi:hypothetical protein
MKWHFLWTKHGCISFTMLYIFFINIYGNKVKLLNTKYLNILYKPTIIIIDMTDNIFKIIFFALVTTQW